MTGLAGYFIQSPTKLHNLYNLAAFPRLHSGMLATVQINFFICMIYLTVSSSGYTVSNDGTTSDKWSQRDAEGTDHGLIWGKRGKSLKTSDYVGSEVLTSVVMKSSIFWDITKWFCWKSTDFSELCLLPASRWFLAWLILRPWRWKLHVPRKVDLLSTDYAVPLLSVYSGGTQFESRPEHRLSWWDFS
jgi:hypothetical protein